MPTKSQITGMRGVYLAAAELARRGLIASPTSRSAAGADILITDDKCRMAYSVQVKTTASGYKYWLLNAKAKDVKSRSHLYMFVDIHDEDGTVKFYIVPSAKVAQHHDIVRQPKHIWYSFSREKAEKHHIEL